MHTLAASQNNSDTIIARLAHWASVQPSKTAYTFLKEKDDQEACITFAELWEETQAVSRRLHQQNILPGARVILLYPPGLSFLPAFLGCLAAGVIAIPAYPPRNARHMPRIELIIQDAQAQAVLTADSISGKIQDWLSSHQGNPLPVITTDKAPNDATLPQSNNYTPIPSDIAFLQYTSGSTASPKGVIITHDNIIYNEEMLTTVTHLDNDSVWVTWLPVFHDMGLIAGMLHPLYLGAHCVFMAPTSFIQKPLRWLQAITKYRPAKTGGPNFAFELCVNKIPEDALADLDLSSLKSLFNGAEPIRIEIMEAFAQKFARCGFKPEMFFPCYGMAESTLIASGNPVGTLPYYTTFNAADLEQNRAVLADTTTDKTIRLIGCGQQSILEDRILIADPDSFAELIEGQVGEIWIQGRHVAQGYWNNPEATETNFRAFTSNTNQGPFLRTGDLGFLYQGQLYICGRLKDLVIIHGRNIYPQDIEVCAQEAFPGLRASSGAAFALTLEGEEQLIIVQEVEREVLKKLDFDAACLAIRQAVAKEHEVEVHAVTLIYPGTLAKTSSGKIQRKQCAQLYQENALKIAGAWKRSSIAEIDVSNSTQHTREAVTAWLTSAVAKLAGIPKEQIRTAAPFAHYALDSTALITLSGELSTWLQQDISPTLLYDYPTIQSLTDQLTADNSQATSSEIERSHAKQDDAVAIIGMGCRFPGDADSLDQYWELLLNGCDAIEEIPAERWDWRTHYSTDLQAGKMTTRFGGFLKNVDQFDAEFFGISPREARNLDPQQRLLLEVAWQALENAAINPDSLRGSASGIFVGISNNDYAQLSLRNDAQLIDTNTGTGNALSAAAGRLAYTLDWQGPALAIDTACSSSLVAVDQACQSLLSGQTNLSLAAGVNLILSPELTITFSQSQMMAHDGRCKAFDQSANGYVRGEGCGVVILKRLSDAQRDQDNIVAIIKGSAVNQDGASNGLTAPNGTAQERVIQQALSVANLAPESISYVEAHGTGTALGDPIEVKALARAYKRDAAEQPNLFVGSVKTNIGHLEAAAGIASLIKTALTLKHQYLPKSLHFNNPNEHIDWNNCSIKVADASQADPQMNYAAVSSFGFTGTNAHVILEAASAKTANLTNTDTPTLFCFSARNDDALNTYTESFITYLQGTDASLSGIAHTLACGRQHFEKRRFIVAENKASLLQQLETSDEPNDSVSPHKVCFFFTGQGSQYPKMGYELYKRYPLFREHFDRCNEILNTRFELDLIDLVFNEQASQEQLNQTANTQPALFALEYCLAQLWLSWGVQPDAITGHSLGEYVAATIAGVFSLEDGLTLVAERGRLMQALPDNGSMTAVFASVTDLQPHLAPFANQIGIASTNAPQETVISGEKSALLELQESLDAHNISYVPLKVSHAFHSPLMEPMLDAFKACFESITLHPPQIPLISNITGQPIAANSIVDPNYWIKHILEPVRFTNIAHWLQENAFNTFIEIGPKPLLLALAQKTWTEAPSLQLPSLKSANADLTQLQTSLGKLYTSGYSISWKKVFAYQSAQRVQLPHYAFQRKRYWIDAPVKNSFITTQNDHPILGNCLPTTAHEASQKVWQKEFQISALIDYKIKGKRTLSAASFAQAAWAAAQALPVEINSTVQLGATEFKPYTVTSTDEDGLLSMQTVLRWGSDHQPLVRSYIREADDAPWQLIATAKIDQRCSDEAAPDTAQDKTMQFGIMFFNGTENSTQPASNYQLVLESTRFADRHGFSSVWVPERHYTSFGSLYPNPIVLLSALARETEQIRLMAGSLVMPLHHPLRVAEDWALVDNLSLGRVGLSFASGWNPNDFAMAPENYEQRHQTLFEGIEAVRKLWRGETLQTKSGDGRDIEVRTYPTPLQEELPFWVTAAGNPKTFYEAGRRGANILTHLLDQGPTELAEKLEHYRRGRAESDLDPFGGKVSIMIHTFVGPENDAVKEIVREPYCEFLQENLHLLKGLATSRGGEVDIDALSDTDKAEFVGFLFERFYAERALMGTPDKCQKLVDELIAAGVTEIACLLDFGPSTENVLASLPYLNQLKSRYPDTVAQGTAQLQNQQETLNIKQLQDELPMQLSAQRFYLQLEHRGVRIESNLQYLENSWRKDGHALAALNLPQNYTQEILIESALQNMACAIPDESFAVGGGRLYQPVGFSAWSGLPENSIPAFAYAELRPDTQTNRVNCFQGNVTFCDTTDTILGTLQNVCFEPEVTLNAEDNAATQSDRFYQVDWILKDKDSQQEQKIIPKTWLLLEDNIHVAQQIANAFEARGQQVRSLTLSDLDIQDPQCFDRYFEAYPELLAEPLGILHAGSLDVVPHSTLDAQSLEYAVQTSCAGLLHLVQCLNRKAQTATLWILTHQAQPAEDDSTLQGIAAAPLWGFGKVIALEHPEIWGGMVDLSELTTSSFASAVDECLLPDGEDNIAYRGEKRLVSRLQRSPAPEPAKLQLKSDALYLITGGLGGIGRKLAQFLIERGAQHLCLIGLHGLPESAFNGHSSEETQKRLDAVQQLEASGATVHLIQADVSDHTQMTVAFEQIEALPQALRGIFHLAGKPEIRSLAETVFQTHREVLDPKIAGTWNLHQLSNHLTLDHFVCYSSISGAWGSAGQPFYSAANHFMDVFAHYRSQLGKPTTTINWGPWSEGGMLTDEDKSFLATMGIWGFSQEEALSALEQLMVAGTVNAVAVKVDWRIFKDLFETRGARPLLADMGAENDSTDSHSATEVTLTKQALALTEQTADVGQEALATILAQELAQVLGYASTDSLPHDRGFFEMGLDSLMAIELKNRLQAALGLPLKTTLAFNYPSITALAQFLFGELQTANNVSGTTPTNSDTIDAEAALIAEVEAQTENLSDEALLKLLEEELES